MSENKRKLAPATPSDRRTVASILQHIVRALLDREVAIADVVGLAAAAVAGVDGTNSEQPMAVRIREARCARRNAMMTELRQLEHAGRGRAAVSIVAKKFARDPHDAAEVDALSRSLRRWRRK